MLYEIRADEAKGLSFQGSGTPLTQHRLARNMLHNIGSSGPADRSAPLACFGESFASDINASSATLELESQTVV